VDQGQFEQVIINLAVNARDAMPNGGKLTVATANRSLAAPLVQGTETVPRGDYVVIVVEDTGTGIAPEHLTRIFEPFFSTKPVGGGTGLGLSTVYGIVKQTGGFVFVESALGRGTRFTIWLPRYSGPADSDLSEDDSERRVGRDRTGAGTVLLVEDEDPVRLFSARALRSKGYKVIETRSGETALEVLADQTSAIDLMITDVMMPEIDGPTLIRMARGRLPRLPVICISGYAEEALREKIPRDADTHFLPKPFSLKQLAGKVKDVLGPQR
jgi:two-component system cell cycle sensor histidine kinase/response regulator CckA